MDQSQYNTKDGIAAAIANNGLAGLRAIMEARRQTMEALWARERDGAEISRDEYLTAFVVLGRFSLDPNGGASRVNRNMVTDADRASAPPVMTTDEWATFWAPIAARNAHLDRWPSGPFDGHEGGESDLPIPPAHVVCARCKRGWTLEACHEIVGEEDRTDGEGPFPLAPYVGRTLREVQADIATRTDGEHRLNLMVYNDQWVDQSVPEQMRVGSQTGWRHDDRRSSPEITWDYVVQSGDGGSVHIDRFYHAACHGEHEADQRAAGRECNCIGIETMLTECGFTDVRVELAPTPQHLITWAASEEEDGGEDPEKVAAAMQRESEYYRITTGQGTFGVWKAVYPALDLKGTGIALTDIAPELADAPTGFPPIIGLTGEREQLLLLWQLLVKKQRSQQPPAPPATPAP